MDSFEKAKRVEMDVTVKNLHISTAAPPPPIAHRAAHHTFFRKYPIQYGR